MNAPSQAILLVDDDVDPCRNVRSHDEAVMGDTMPGMDGVTLDRRLRARHPETVALLTLLDLLFGPSSSESR